MLKTRADITMGGGATTFAETATAGKYKGLTLQQQAEARGYQILTDQTDLHFTIASALKLSTAPKAKD